MINPTNASEYTYYNIIPYLKYVNYNDAKSNCNINAIEMGNFQDNLTEPVQCWQYFEASNTIMLMCASAPFLRFIFVIASSSAAFSPNSIV